MLDGSTVLLWGAVGGASTLVLSLVNRGRLERSRRSPFRSDLYSWVFVQGFLLPLIGAVSAYIEFSVMAETPPLHIIAAAGASAPLFFHGLLYGTPPPDGD